MKKIRHEVILCLLWIFMPTIFCGCVCVWTVTCASGTYTVLRFHVKLPVLQMHCVVDIRPMAQHWLSGMSRDTERYHLYCVIHIIAYNADEYYGLVSFYRFVTCY